MALKYVSCVKCGHRNDRAGGRRKCENIDCRAPLPKRRVPKHAETLRDEPYTKYVALNAAIHRLDFNDEACGVCGRAKPETRRHDRDHDHRTGLARGLACVRCNRELLRNSTLEEARAVVAYLERVEAYYAREASGVV
jgi:Recombination endonuclease VII